MNQFVLRTWQDGSGFVVSCQYFGHTSVRDSELPRDVAGPDSELGQLNDPDPNVVGQRPAVHEHPAQLVNLAILVQLRI